MEIIKGPASYVLLLDEVVKKRAAEQKPGMPLRPSNAGTCSRRLAYEYIAYLSGTAENEERKPSVERLLKLGHFVEEAVVEDLKDIPEMGVRFTQQLVEIFTLPHGTSIEGSTDAVMWSEDVRGVLDVKSIGDRWHAAFASKWDSLLSFYRTCSEEFDTNSFYVRDLARFLRDIGVDDSLYKNLIQLNLYACTDFLKKRGVDHASILRYNKNNSQLMEIRFEPSEEVYENTRRRLTLVEEAGHRGNPEIAPKERLLGSMDCTYCPFLKECWGNRSSKEVYRNAPKKNWATKTVKLKDGAQLEELFAARSEAELASSELKKIDEEIIFILDCNKVSKVKLESGEVFDLKYLKSGVEVRRGKE